MRQGKRSLNGMLLVVSGLVMMTMSGMVLVGSRVLADDAVTVQTSIMVPIACTMQGTGTTHAATLSPNTYSGASGSAYENGIGKTTLTAICNDDNGFSIYAIGYTGNSYTDTNHTKLVGNTTGGTINTAVYANGDSTSSWSMKLIKVTDASESYNPQNLTISTGYDDWIAVPASFTKVAQYKANTGSSTTDMTLGVKLETTYAAYVSANQSADTYIGQVKYTMVHPYNEEPVQPQQATAGCINYFANASSAVGSMGCQSATDGNTITLLASNFSRTGYGFAGWSDKFDYATNIEAHFYGPQEDITVPTGTTANGLSLYAVWVKSQGNLQDASKVSSICSGLTTAPTDGTANLSSISALTDQRDNETYAIAKLADGKCWMIENLRLESTNSDNSTGALAQGYGTSTTYGNFGGLADAESAKFSNSTTANSLYYSGTQSGDATINIGTTNYPAYRMPRYNNLNTQSRAQNSPNSNTFSDDNTTGGMYSYGNYYTWHAAIADLTYNDTNNSTVTNTSLCPSGWRLPQGGNKTRITSNDDNDFWNLTVDALNGGTNPANYDSSDSPYYNGTAEAGPVTARLRAYPNNFLYSGYFYTSSAYSRGSSGYYWSSTAYNNYGSYNLRLDSSRVYPGTDYGVKYLGYSIRCTVSAGT
ncbi:hypothetical protein IKF30_00035 [Candidatus Saccharibacteria bacterium]|nr:hypothetical protein [Candidatus Saccharibacteria bacterium]